MALYDTADNSATIIYNPITSVDNSPSCMWLSRSATAANYECGAGSAEGGANSVNGSCLNGRLSEGTRDNTVSLLKVSG